MMERIRNRLWQLRQSLAAAMRPQKRKGAGPVPLKGNIQNVIVVKPQNKMFSQAVFILNEDYIGQSRLNSQELLRQAREAAGEYGGAMMQPARRWRPYKTLTAVLAAAVFLLAAYYFIFM